MASFGQARLPGGFPTDSSITAPTDVLFISNLSETIEIQEKASRDAALAAGEVVRGYIRKVTLANGFKGTREEGPIEFADDISVEYMEESDPPEVRIGLKEKDAPDRPYGVFWEVGHFNVYTDGYERERWLSGAIQKTRQVQSNAAVAAAETQLSLKKQVTGFARGFAVFGAVSFFT